MAIVVTNEIRAKKGDTLTPWNIFIDDFNGTVPDLDDYDTVEFHAWSDATCPASDLVAWTDTNVTVQPLRTFSTDTTTGIAGLYCKNHGLRVGQQVLLSTSDTLPDGLEEDYNYYVARVNGANHFWLSRLKNGTQISIADTGLGTHQFKVMAHTQYQPQSADVDTVGSYRCEIRYGNGGAYETFPGDNEGILLTIYDTQCD